MIEKKMTNLSYTNNISDNSNNLIKMCYKLCNQYKLSVTKMKGFNHDDRSFEVQLEGSDVYVYFVHNYEELSIEYKIISNIEIHEKAIEKYIVNGVTKVNYVKGDVVFDDWDNKYIVLENTKIPLCKNGARPVVKVKVQSDKTKEVIEIPDTLISTF